MRLFQKLVKSTFISSNIKDLHKIWQILIKFPCSTADFPHQFMKLAVVNAI